MYDIRFHQILSLIDPQDSSSMMWRPGGLLALETLSLIALLKATKARTVFEFGTFRGQTTWVLAANLQSPGGRVYTLDLPRELSILDGIVWTGTDREVAVASIRCERCFSNSEYESRITEIFCDSMSFDASPFAGQVQYVFIDGNHHEEYVKKDTQNAMLMLADDGPACIVWHDYGTYPHLTRYLDTLSNEIPLYHVAETRLAFYSRIAEGEHDRDSNNNHMVQ